MTGYESLIEVLDLPDPEEIDREDARFAAIIAAVIVEMTGGREPRRTGEKALASVAEEADVQGISIRSADVLLQSNSMSAVSKSQFSRLGAEIDGWVQTFPHRPIGVDWP